MFDPLSIAVALTIFGILVAFLVILFMRKEIRIPNYRAIFWLGLVFLMVYFLGGLSSEREPSSVFLILGITYFAMGLANRDKWGQREPIDENQRKLLIGLAIAGILAFLLGLVVYFLKVPK